MDLQLRTIIKYIHGKSTVRIINRNVNKDTNKGINRVKDILCEFI